MKNYRCAIFGQNTICFKWGFDEDDGYCIAMKQELLQKIMELRQQDVTQFYTACDHGIGLYAAEQINVLMERDRDMKLFCTAPHEEQSTKWAPYLRERYFKMLENCTRTEYAVPFPQTGAQLLAYKRIIDLADMMLTVFDTEALPTGRTEDHALFYAINQHKPVFNLDPYALTMTRIDELGL